MGRLGAQGAGGTIERYAATAQALVRRWELAGDEQVDGKTEEEEKGKDDGGSSYKGWPGSARKPWGSHFPLQRDAQTATRVTGSKSKDRRQCS